MRSLLVCLVAVTALLVVPVLTTAPGRAGAADLIIERTLVFDRHEYVFSCFDPPPNCTAAVRDIYSLSPDPSFSANPPDFSGVQLKLNVGAGSRLVVDDVGVSTSLFFENAGAGRRVVWFFDGGVGGVGTLGSLAYEGGTGTLPTAYNGGADGFADTGQRVQFGSGYSGGGGFSFEGVSLAVSQNTAGMSGGTYGSSGNVLVLGYVLTNLSTDPGDPGSFSRIESSLVPALTLPGLVFLLTLLMATGVWLGRRRHAANAVAARSV